jgi:hypothetical protein
MKYSVIFRSPAFTILVAGLFWISSSSPEIRAQESSAQTIEIFSGGKHYDSLEGYRKKGEEDQGAIGLENSGMDFSEVRQMFDDAVRTSTNPLDLKFDPTKMKTIVIEPLDGAAPAPGPSRSPLGNEPIKDPFIHSYTLLNKLGFDTAIKEVVTEFAVAPTGGREKAVVNTKDLERVLRDSFGDSNQPLLLISDDNKLRVMTLDPSELDPKQFDDQQAQ